MPALHIHLVRHGQTAASRETRFSGTTDPPLTELGQEMANHIAERCAREGDWKAIYASPMLRARQTAEPAARRLGLTVQIEPGVREIAYGSWENRLEKEVEEHEAEALRAWVSHPGKVAPPGGETGADIAARALPAIERIRARHEAEGGDVLVVSHKATIRVLVCALLGIDVDLFRARIAAPVGGFTTFEFRPAGPLLVRLGDVCHLPPALRKAGS